MPFATIYIQDGPLKDLGAGRRTVWVKEARRYVYVVCPFTLTVSKTDKRGWADHKPQSRGPIKASDLRRYAKDRASYKTFNKTHKALIKEMVGMSGWFR